MTQALFQAFTSDKLELKNRVVMAPMTREQSPDGTPTDDVATYYRRRAEGGCGLIITEGTTIDHDVASLNARTVPYFHGDSALAGWKNVVDSVHAAGSKIFPQLWHAGMMRDPRGAPNPEQASVGPSGLLKPGKQITDPMSDAAVQAVIDGFVSAAVSAQKLGFDGIEIHGAHGYLVDQFFWGATNLRDDRWGGDLVERTRFAVDIITGIRAAVGPDYPICLRYSQWKQQDYSQRLAETPDALASFLQPLTDAGVDLFHCSTRRYWETEFDDSGLNLAGWTKKLTGKPTITVGSVGLDADFLNSMAGGDAKLASIDRLLEKLEAGEFDLVAVGRMLIADPHWANKVQTGAFDSILPFSKDSAAVYP